MSRPASTAPKDAASKLIFAPPDPQYHLSTLPLSSLSPSPLTQFHTWYTSALSTSVHQPETTCLSTAHLPSGAVSSRYVYLKELDARGFVIYSNWGTSRKASDIQSNAQASLAFWWREVERQVRVEGRCERLTRGESEAYFRTRARGSKVGAWASRQSVVLREEEGGRGVLEGWVKEVEERFGGADGGAEDAGAGGGEENGGVAGRDKNARAEGVDQTAGVDDEQQPEKQPEQREANDKVTEKANENRNNTEQEIPCPDFWGGLRIIPSMVEFWQGRDSRLHDRFRYTKVDEEAGEGEGEGEGKWKIERLSP